MSLFHYTCDHRVDLIRAEGVVVPFATIWQPEVELSWWTDLDKPDRYALGITSYLTSCDRTAHRFAAADDSAVVSWGEWAHRNKVSRAVRDLLEAEPGARPAHWYVSDRPVAVL